METLEGPDASTPEPRAPFRVISILVGDGREPPSGMTDLEASAVWSAATSPWHPALLGLADDLPRLEDIASPSNPQTGEVRLVARGCLAQLPSGYRDLARNVGVPIVEGSEDRMATVRSLLAHAPGSSVVGDLGDIVAGDYLALGAAAWWLRDLTIAMGHVDTLSRSSLALETLEGARAWRLGDASAAVNRLRAAFERISEARERFYPMDGYVLDLCLLDPATPGPALADVLPHHTPFTILGSARAIQVFAEREPDRAVELREAITEGWADVVGGAYDEVDEPFLPWSSIAWQFRQGSETYRSHLDERNVETLARRRFGLYPQLSQVARRFGLRFGIFVALDAGRFPVHAESKRLWASSDGTTLESITRPPIAADRPIEGVKLPWRVARSMKEDVVATLLVAHWPSPVAGWFADFRRTAAYAPVLSRWVTVNDFFHRSDRPFEEITPGLDDYIPAYLAQAAARREPSPIASRARHARLRARFDALVSTHALASALAGFEAEELDPAIEFGLETGHLDEARREVDRLIDDEAESLARRIVDETATDRPGFLIINPLGLARRVAVLLPGASPDLRPEGPLRVAQLTEEGVWGIVELPPFGFAWVPRESPADRPLTPSGLTSIKDRTLANESLTVSIDPSTGGIRSIQSIVEETPRIGQQLVINGLVGPDGKAAVSRMRATSIKADYGGPALAQATTRGTIHDPLDGRKLAAFEQRFRLWSGRPILEIAIKLSDLDPAWLERLAGNDPWTHHLACRWAWPDPQATLKRTALLAPTATNAERPETPDALEITSRQRRTTLLFGGLAHHRRHTSRMLDTLLVAGSESGRSFELGVALDLDHAFPAALDLTAPAIVVPVESGPPSTGPAGWLVQVDHKSVAVLRLAFVPDPGDGLGWGLALDLIETAGKAARCRLRVFRDPVSARQVNGLGEHIYDLSIDRDAALIDLTPHEIARVELILG